MSPGKIAERAERELESLRRESQYRTLDVCTGINLCSNDYLGLATDPRLKKAVLEGVAASNAVASTGSRLLAGNSREWEQLEADFASFAGTESALYFGSGYAANVGLLSSLLKPGDVVFSDALNHASLIDGIRLSRATKIIYPHCDLDFLESALREHAADPGARVIVTESLFSMEGDVAPLRELLDLANRYGAELVIDEAHATGTRGPHGRGVAAELGIEREMLAIVHTCGKALASAGAFVCGGRMLRHYLINRARTFIFSTALPPYMTDQIRAALKLASDADLERARLHELAEILRRGLAAAGISTANSSTHIVPAIFGTNELALHVASEVQRAGFAVRAIRPPTVPPGTARVRVSLTSNIAVADVQRLVATMTNAFRSLTQAQPAAAGIHA